MTTDIFRDNQLLDIIRRVSDNSNALTLPSHKEIFDAIHQHNKYEMVKKDPELILMLDEAAEMRQTFTSLSDLRWAYEKLLLTYVKLLTHECCYCLMYRWNEDEGLAISKTIELVGDNLMDLYDIRTVTRSEGVFNHEFHNGLTRNLFDALVIRLRGAHITPTHYGYREANQVQEGL